MLSVSASALRQGRRLRHHRRLIQASDLDEITITGYGPFPYQVDGDYLGKADRLVLSWEPHVLTLVVPVPPDEPLAG
jgi:diacylglycerol kinase family enzyme